MSTPHPSSKERLDTHGPILTFKRLLLVGVAVAAGAAYAKREQRAPAAPGRLVAVARAVLARRAAGSVQLRRARGRPPTPRRRCPRPSRS